MATLRHRLIGAGLRGFTATGLHARMAPWTRGRGAILAFHHVRPVQPRAFAPNRLLEITPDHLDAVLHHTAKLGYEVVRLADVVPRLAGGPARPFVALTFDDGYRDNVAHALPVLERHRAPFTVFATTGFADRTARLWWLELEDALGRATTLRVPLGGRIRTLPARTSAQKARAFETLARHLRGARPPEITAALDALGCSPTAARALVEKLCLSWGELADLAGHPLATIGCHTATHPNLMRLDPASLDRELVDARASLERHLGRPAPLLAYPYGGRTAAAAREFAAAQQAGFAAAVTTRPGVLWSSDAGRPTALPRLSINGLWPDLATLEVLLSGAPAAWQSLASRWFGP